MYIRTQEEALSAIAEILDLPQRRDQLVQATVKIMLCMEAEPRSFMVDCQALLVEGGLEALQRKRRDLLESLEKAPFVILDPEDDRLFEATACALDALRFAGVAAQVFPDIASSRESWQTARAILAGEASFKEALTRAIRARNYADEFDPARLSVQAMIDAQRPDWIDRAGEIRSACLDALRRSSDIPTERLEEEAGTVFSVLAVSDERVRQILAVRENDPAAADERIRQAYGLIVAVRSMAAAPPAGGEGRGLEQVA